PGSVMTIARILAFLSPAASPCYLVIVQKLDPKRGGPRAADDASDRAGSVKERSFKNVTEPRRLCQPGLWTSPPGPAAMSALLDGPNQARGPAAIHTSVQAGERRLDDSLKYVPARAGLADDHQPHPGRHQLSRLRARIHVRGDLTLALGVTQRQLSVSLQPLHVVADDRPDFGVLRC